MAQETQPSLVEERFNQIVDEFGRFLRLTIARLCPHDQGLQFDDIEQEARLRLWRALQGETEINNLASYLYRIAATATIDAMRRVGARHEKQLGVPDDEQEVAGNVYLLPAVTSLSPERVAEQEQVIGKVEAALDCLSPERRRAAGLHLQGFTTLEIAEVMNWSEPKARNLVYRGLKDLRLLLRTAGVEYEID